MSSRVTLSRRDLSLLRFLSWTPATTRLLLKASCTFEGEPFADERRLRERLQALVEAGLARTWTVAYASGGLQNYYKPTLLGYQHVHGVEAEPPSRAFFAEVSPSLVAHTFRLAEAIVTVLQACHVRGVTVERFLRENELEFRVGEDRVYPDCFFRLKSGERCFNLAFEIDNSTESIDSRALTSITHKLSVYHAYQHQLLVQWLAAGKAWERPRFRVVFLTQSVARAYHILAVAAASTAHPSRRVVYAATHQDFVADADPVFGPVFLDHFGQWQSLIDLHPTAPYQKAPVRLVRPVESPLGIC
jgi:hypothetical protein